MESLECSNIIEKSWYENNIVLHVDTRRVATICLNRQDKHNALNSEMLEALNQAFDFLEEYHSENNSNVKLLLLKAMGKSFCAGADLQSMQKMINFSYDENYQDAIELSQVLDRLSNFATPTGAIIQGDAYGGGVGLICAADFAIAIKGAKFCLSEVKLGLIPAVICPYLVSTMGYKLALRQILTAEVFNADRALSLTMLSDIAETTEDLTNKANQFVRSLLNNGPIAMQKAKAMTKNVYHQEPDLINRTAEAIAKIRVSPEGQEGLIAFLEKRKPNWILNDK